MSKEERERDYLPQLSDNQDMLSWLFHGLWASEERFFRAFWSKDILHSHLQYLKKIFSGLDDLYQTFVLDSTSSFSSLK